MCLILFAYRCVPGIPLVVAANRDEFYARPSRPLGFWPENRQLLAGRDEREGGTWLGITRGGRFAAVTNYREPPDPRPAPASRGDLTLSFLNATQKPAYWMIGHAQDTHRYGGFNLLAGDASGLWYLSNRGDDHQPRALPPGLYGLSNDLLDTPWFKVVEGKQALQTACETGAAHADLLALLGDRQRADHKQLPHTGINPRLERLFSSRFIRSPWYGTRACTAVTIDESGEVSVSERSFTRFGIRKKLRNHRFRLIESDRW